MKTTTIDHFLTRSQIAECRKLKQAKEIAERVIKPNLEAINAKLGQENDPMYLAYAVEYVLTQIKG